MNTRIKKLLNFATRVVLTAFLLLVLVITVSTWFLTHQMLWQWPLQVSVKFNQVLTIKKVEVINPMVREVKAQTPKFEPKNDIEKEIYAVFGEEHFDKTMKLLECENRTLNPKAVNYNKDENGVVLSKDYGVFQINNFWQGVTNTNFLFDPAINIRIAYNIYKNSDFTFKMWSCGKRLSI